MVRNELENEYFNWINQLVYNDGYTMGLSHRSLLEHLNDVEFTYILEMDKNRESDGIDLRYRFGYENNYSSNTVSLYLNTRPCSILEMMVALALRCEESIMSDPDLGDRVGVWFWTMISSLGLLSMDDSNYDANYVDSIIDIFLERDYKPNGQGGLFTIDDFETDLRDIEIWYQMCWYLDSLM